MAKNLFRKIGSWLAVAALSVGMLSAAGFPI